MPRTLQYWPTLIDSLITLPRMSTYQTVFRPTNDIELMGGVFDLAIPVGFGIYGPWTHLAQIFGQSIRRALAALAPAHAGFHPNPQRQKLHQHVQNQRHENEIVHQSERRDRKIEWLECIQGQHNGGRPQPDRPLRMSEGNGTLRR